MKIDKKDVKQGGETNVRIKEKQSDETRPGLPSRPSFFLAFPREANRVKADVPEAKLDPADPTQLEFRFTRNSAPPSSFRLLRYLKQFDSLACNSTFVVFT